MDFPKCYLAYGRIDVRGSHPPHVNFASSRFLFLVFTSNDSNRYSTPGMGYIGSWISSWLLSV